MRKPIIHSSQTKIKIGFFLTLQSYIKFIFGFDLLTILLSCGFKINSLLLIKAISNLKNNSKLSKFPVVVFSTLGQESDIKKAIELGAKDYVNKSYFDLNVLLTKISQVVKK